MFENNRWTKQAYIKASNADPDDRFGSAIALSGNVLVVGAPREDGNATGVNGEESDNSSSNSGAVYVFERDNGRWRQTAYVKASNTDAGDNFGASVSISADGNALVVGAPVEESATTGIDGDQTNNSVFGAGAAYLFVRNVNGWSQQAYIKASNTDAGDRFGASIAISGDGNTIVTSAASEESSTTGINGEETDSASNAGAAYLFSF